MSSIASKLNELVALVERLGYPISQFLRAPLSEAEIRERAKVLPFVQPSEIVDLYEWHDGLEDQTEVPLFRDNRFLLFEEALYEYSMMCQYCIPAAGDVDFGVDLRQCFPFAGFEGALYVLPSGSQSLMPDVDRPVISVFEAVEVYFRSFQIMIDTIYAWYDAGAHRFEYGENAYVDESKEMEIWRRLNPGVFV